MSGSSVVAAIATYRRPAELSRLIHSLEQTTSGLHGMIVVDNADDPQTRAIVEGSSLQARCITPGRNLGCGGGLRLAEKTAFEIFPALTHIWILDDDTVVTAATLELLLAAMEVEHADAAYPLVVAADGSLGWFPGLLDPIKFRVIRQRQTPEEFIARCGAEPIPFSWAQGIALIVTRRAFEEIGFHRDDYWVRGEDLEFSLRITHRHRGIYVPRARAQHLPPPAGEAPDDLGEYAKHRAMLQNLAYTSLRQRHGLRLARTIPGNWLRFIRTWGWRPHVLADAALTLARGALLGSPAGRGSPRI
jgi:GT2 family glycosyltransferase